MAQRLDAIGRRYRELNELLADPELFTDPERAQRYAKERASLADLVDRHHEWQRLQRTVEETEPLERVAEPELQRLAAQELAELRRQQAALETELTSLLLPKDPRDQKNVFIEIRAGTGGDEAALFAAELMRMYTKYAEARKWRVELMSSNPTGLGGFKEVIIAVAGKGVYSRLKFESGVHRVQRVPATEASGRIHTSTVTVAVLPEAEEIELQIDPNELRVDTYCASGPGGQGVNTTHSAVRLTHLPTGVVVTCQDERSQIKNKAKAMRVLRARLLETAQAAREAEIAQDRRMQIGTGERSEKIRTYNFPQNRVTDHRIGLTLRRLADVMAGDLDELLDGLTAAEHEKQLGSEEPPAGNGARR
ncbi:MAG: peptide chain release factor 1 [Nitrospirota bacterium]